MFQTLRNAWKIEDLRKKILYTIFIVLIFRLGSAVTVPFIDVSALKEAVSNSSSVMGYLTMMSGGGFTNGSVFALSITPYINASIIIQLLTVAIPALERMAKDGEAIVIVSDWEKGGAYAIRPDCAALGIAAGFKAYDFETGAEIPLSGGAVSVPVPAYDFRIVRFK